MVKPAKFGENASGPFDRPGDFAKDNLPIDDVGGPGFGHPDRGPDLPDLSSLDRPDGSPDLSNRPISPAAMKIVRDNEKLKSEQAERDNDMSGALKREAAQVNNDAAAVGEDLSELARTAVSAIRKIADELAAKAGVKAEEAVDVIKSAAATTADNINTMAVEARGATEEGLQSLSQRVSRNPLTSIAIAAGVGMIFGLMSRSDHRR